MKTPIVQGYIGQDNSKLNNSYLIRILIWSTLIKLNLQKVQSLWHPNFKQKIETAQFYLSLINSRKTGISDKHNI